MESMRWKHLTGMSRVLLLLAVAFFILAFIGLGYGFCPVSQYPNPIPSGGCYEPLSNPFWPLAFVPSALALFGFIYSVKWGHW